MSAPEATFDDVAKLIYSTTASLDGYIADEKGDFDWAAPDAEVHAFVNDLQRSVGTYLFGRRLYETMSVWDTLDLSDEPAEMRDFAAIWRGIDKVVYSSTLPSVSAPRTRLERSFDPDAVRTMKGSAASDLAIGGPGLAADAFRAGVVDEIALFIAPHVVGGGTAALPDGLRCGLELMDERRFRGGTVYLNYRVTT
jgi:dihydrofolate reductase